jgi:DNA-binding NtrC family response regulator
MGSRSKIPGEKVGPYAFRAIEIVAIKKSSAVSHAAWSGVVLVDSQIDTINFVEQHIREFVGNVTKVRRLEARKRNVDESVRLFEENLRQLFGVIAESVESNLLEKFSVSLRKALIHIAIERSKDDKDRICSILGIDRSKLEEEMKICGLCWQDESNLER